MKKAIVIIDVPDYLDIEQNKVRCELLGKVFVENHARKDIEYLDLKPLPQKEDEYERGIGEYNKWLRIGYNRCIDEILGEEE